MSKEAVIGWVRESKPNIFWFGENKPAHFDEDEGDPVIGYEEDLSSEADYNGDLIPLTEWLECVEDGGFIDYDGYGDQVIHNPDKNKYYVVERADTDMGVVYPSMAEHVPSYITHILWYNR